MLGEASKNLESKSLQEVRTDWSTSFPKYYDSTTYAGQGPLIKRIIDQSMG